MTITAAVDNGVRKRGTTGAITAAWTVRKPILRRVERAQPDALPTLGRDDR